MSKPTIEEMNIYAENELTEPATANDFLAVQTEGKRQVQRRILHYNLDAIIAVGYRAQDGSYRTQRGKT